MLNAGKVALKSPSGIKKTSVHTLCKRAGRERAIGRINNWVKYTHAEHVESESCVMYIGAAWRALIVLIENSSVSLRKM